jgi:site-specific DNA-methyltransferase (adenine-specific)
MEEVDPRILVGNCLDTLKTLDDASISSIVTDPPYELGFMGKTWDASGIAYNVELWRECLRVLKPGGHLLAFGGTRTYHRMAVAIEDAGFEIRDSIHWIYGSGFPKSLDVSKAIDKAAGAKRDKVPATGGLHNNANLNDDGWSKVGSSAPMMDGPTASTKAAKTWQGWGTALKPAHEPIVVARKPLVGTVAANVLAHGTGALNIDGCRVGSEIITINTFDNGAKPFGDAVGEPYTSRQSSGRWPANIIFDEEAGAELDAQSGQVGALAPASGPTYAGPSKSGSMAGAFKGNGDAVPAFHNDKGGASRFFYCPKPGKKERNAGGTNTHPTVKPVALMRYLVRLVTPPGGIVLDPFLGSGTTAMAATLEGFDWRGCEMTAEYLPIIDGRVKWAEKEHKREQPKLPFDETTHDRDK